MNKVDKTQPTIAVIGLGYVGLPLAAALARHFDTVGFDVNPSRVAALLDGKDGTGEIDSMTLADSSLTFSSDAAAIQGRDIYIVAVPTPVDDAKRPDLSAVEGAARTVGAAMAPGAVVVFESTVYPGVTEDVCGPVLAKASGLLCGRDFFLGYSPERINPGDRAHRIDNITKVVAGQTADIAGQLADMYGRINGGDVFVAADIRTAEAAKVIENAQRDINIAFINEVAMIFDRMGLSTEDVLAAAATKWNFLDFKPGLVGGHCIGVDPYYLAHAAQAMNHEPEIILSGRRINDGMSRYVADRIAAQLDGPSRILVLGLTFKENVPDLRNSQIPDIVKHLAAAGHDVAVHDPLADACDARTLYGIELLDILGTAYDGVVGAVAHNAYSDINLSDIVVPGGLVADVKGLWRDRTKGDGFRYWSF
ncbi:MAG: nucleotide sugar dehydrogenase [Alphaproteobacteria bacterium]|nr:nucleotide sugar dehydrogenase [Alphaproteobacteria bacterium]